MAGLVIRKRGTQTAAVLIPKKIGFVSTPHYSASDLMR